MAYLKCVKILMKIINLNCEVSSSEALEGMTATNLHWNVKLIYVRCFVKDVSPCYYKIWSQSRFDKVESSGNVV